MPGKEPRRKDSRRHNPLGEDLAADRFASFKGGKLNNAGDDDDADAGVLLPNRSTQRILKAARRQLEKTALDAEAELEAESEGEEEDPLGDDDGQQYAEDNEDDLPLADGEDDDDEEVELEYDDQSSVQSEVVDYNDLGDDYAIDEEESRLLSRFMPASAAQTRNLADIIMEKIREKERQEQGKKGGAEEDDDGTPKIDKRVAKVYSAIGTVLKNYTSGKIPKAFKVLPNIQNWEQLLMLTRPHEWSPHATYNATRIFAANLNEKMAQRFYASCLLPIVHHRMQEDRKLHPSLYMAIRKALFKPVAFYKGFLLPLVQDEECTLREALVVASVLQKTHLPPVPTAVTIVKITQLHFSGPCCVLLRVLIDKKMSMPYQAVDALVKYFHRFTQSHTREEVLPVLWHQTLLSFVQRYRQDLVPEQLELLQQLCAKHFHHMITPEVRREIAAAQGKKSMLL